MIKKGKIVISFCYQVEPDLLPRPTFDHSTISLEPWAPDGSSDCIPKSIFLLAFAAPCKGFSIDENHIVSSLSEIILARLLLKDIESSTLLTFRHFEASEIAFHVSLSQCRREASSRELGGGFSNVGLPPGYHHTHGSPSHRRNIVGRMPATRASWTWSISITTSTWIDFFFFPWLAGDEMENSLTCF